MRGAARRAVQRLREVLALAARPERLQLSLEVLDHLVFRADDGGQLVGIVYQKITLVCLAARLDLLLQITDFRVPGGQRLAQAHDLPIQGVRGSFVAQRRGHRHQRLPPAPAPAGVCQAARLECRAPRRGPGADPRWA